MSDSGFVLLSGSRPTIAKDPDASRFYGIDVTDTLAAGDAVNGASVSASSADLTLGTAAFDGAIVSVRVAGGTAGSTSSVTLRWTTTGGDTDERTLYFRVVER